MDTTVKTLLILGLVFGFVFAGRYLRHRRHLFEMQLRAEREYSGELKMELQDIRDRVAALETIVTAKGYRVGEEIDGL